MSASGDDQATLQDAGPRPRREPICRVRLAQINYISGNANDYLLSACGTYELRHTIRLLLFASADSC